jgi:tetratricopeptide (TPR) repeat protein
MAEQVQAVLDRMVPGLVELQERGLLKEDEVPLVVARRRTSEYALRRRAPRQSDFLDYISAETTLLRLVQLREQKERRQRVVSHDDNDNDDPKKKRRSATIHVMQFLHLLWVRTLRKYRSQVDLYLQYASFCKEQNSFSRLTACYQEALRFHSSHIPLWIEAASFEYFDNHSLPAARILLQRAIRLYPHNGRLWVQHFTLELHAAVKLRGRRTILHNKDERRDSSDTSDGVVVNVDKSESSSSSHEDYQIAVIVYDNAVASMAKTASSSSGSSTVDWRLECLRACAQFPDTLALQRHIVASLERDCVEEPTAWIARAMYQHQEQQQQQPSNRVSKRQRVSPTITAAESHNESSDAVLDIIREGAATLRTEPMMLQAVQFLRHYANLKTEDDADESSPDDQATNHGNDYFDTLPSHVASVHSLLRSLFLDAQTWGCYTDQVALSHADYLASLDIVLDRDVGPIAVLENHVRQQEQVSKTPSATVWIRWANLEHSEGYGIEHAIKVLKRACRAIAIHEPGHAMILGQLFSAYIHDVRNDHHPRSDTLQQLLILSTTVEQHDVEYPVVESLPNLPTAVRHYLLFSKVNEGRAVYQRNIDALLSSTNFFSQWVKRHTEVVRLLLEDLIYEEEASLSSPATQSRPIKAPRLARLYETAIQTFRPHFPDLAEEFRQQRADHVLYNSTGRYAYFCCDTDVRMVIHFLTIKHAIYAVIPQDCIRKMMRRRMTLQYLCLISNLQSLTKGPWRRHTKGSRFCT